MDDFCGECGGTYTIQRAAHREFTSRVFNQYVCTKQARNEDEFLLSTVKSREQNEDVVSNLVTEAVEQIIDRDNIGTGGPDINTTFTLALFSAPAITTSFVGFVEGLTDLFADVQQTVRNG